MSDFCGPPFAQVPLDLDPPVIVAEQGCDDCSVEPGETHRYAECPGNLRKVPA